MLIYTMTPVSCEVCTPQTIRGKLIGSDYSIELLLCMPNKGLFKCLILPFSYYDEVDIIQI